MTTVEGNKLIAEFMGGKYKTAYEVPVTEGDGFIMPPDGYFECLVGLEYHTSWDWLMPVVEKIESLGGYVRYDTVEVSVYHPGILEMGLAVFSFRRNGVKNQPKMPLLWDGIIKFIQWYNSQNLINSPLK